MKPCPKCGVDNGDAAFECNACGVVFERYGRHKLRRPRPRQVAGIGAVLVILILVLFTVFMMDTGLKEPVVRIVAGADTSDTGDSDTTVELTILEPARVAAIEVVIIPTQEGNRWLADVYMMATDNTASPTQIDGEAELRWGLVQPNQHLETVFIADWTDSELPQHPGVPALFTLLHRIPFDPDTARGMPLRVIVDVEGLRAEATVEL